MDPKKHTDIVLKPTCQNHPSLDVDLSEQRFVTAALLVLQLLIVWWYFPELVSDSSVYLVLLAHFVVQSVRCIGIGRERDRFVTFLGNITYGLFAFTCLFSNLLNPLDGTLGLERLGHLLGVVWPGFLLGLYGRSWDRETMYFSRRRVARRDQTPDMCCFQNEQSNKT